jgi:CHAT domain-containing protein
MIDCISYKNLNICLAFKCRLIFCLAFAVKSVLSTAQETTSDALFKLTTTKPKTALIQARRLEKSAIDDAEIRADAISIQGTAWRNLGQLDSALAQHKRVYQLRKQLFGDQSDAAMRSLNNRALCENNVDSAIYYFKKVIHFREQKKDITTSEKYELGDVYRCIADCFFQKNDFLTARTYAKLAVSGLEGENGTLQAAAFNTLGQCLRYTQDLEGAKAAFQKAVYVAKRRVNQPNLSVFYANLGDCYSDSAAIALPYYAQAVAALGLDKQENRAKIALKIANCYQQQQDSIAAEHVYKQALATTHDPSVSNTCRIRLAALKAKRGEKTAALKELDAVLIILKNIYIKNTNYAFEILEGLSERAKVLFDQSDFTNAQNAFSEAIDFAEKCEKEQQSPQSALILRGYFHDLYGGAAESAARLRDVETAFSFSEKGKAFLQKNNGAIDNTDRYSDKVRAQLRDDEVLLAYSFGRQDLLLFVLTKDKIALQFIKTDSLKETVIRFYAQLNRAPDRRSDPYFHREGASLYEKLVAPANIAEGKRVTIVPDGILNYLPFEAFLTQVVPDNRRHVFNQLPYLLRRHAIRYQAAALLPIVARQSPTKRDLLAIAPQFEGHPSGVLPLKHSEREAQQITTVFGGDILRGGAATESTFKIKAAQYRILHLSTHGILNDVYPENSFLTFATPDSLTVEEIEQLHLSADLVVLSACQSASGAFYGGEGLMSMARAFHMAGSQSVIGSLWNVNDNLSTDLMTFFYENIADGQDKDKALQAAKLRLADGNSPTAAHPYFWAAFTLSGDVTKFEERKTRVTTWILTGLAAILSLLFFYNRRHYLTSI